MLIQLLRTWRRSNDLPSGTLSPDPWDFPHCARNMAGRTDSCPMTTDTACMSLPLACTCGGGALAIDPGRGYIPRAVVEDRALLGSNSSAATVQGHGRRRLCGTSPSPLPCFWHNAINPRGLGTASPRATEIHRSRMNGRSCSPPHSAVVNVDFPGEATQDVARSSAIVCDGNSRRIASNRRS